MKTLVTTVWIALLATILCSFNAYGTVAYVANQNKTITVHNMETGEYIDTLVTLANIPQDILYAPNDILYVTNGTTVSMYNPDTGDHLGDLDLHYSGTAMPRMLTIGPDDYLYVGDFNSRTIKQFDLQTNTYVDTFATISTCEKMMFYDGYLYYSDYFSSKVHRLNGTTGAAIDSPITVGSATGFAISDDGYFYVTNNATTLYVYDSSFNLVHTFSDGAFQQAWDIEFGDDGDLYMASWGANNVVRYDPDSDEILYTFDDTYLSSPRAVTFGAYDPLVVVPEPATMILLGLSGLVLAYRKK